MHFEMPLGPGSIPTVGHCRYLLSHQKQDPVGSNKVRDSKALVKSSAPVQKYIL